MHGRAKGKGKLVVRSSLNRNMKLPGCPGLTGRPIAVRKVSDKYRSSCGMDICCNAQSRCWHKNTMGKIIYGAKTSSVTCL
tara:strand:- start:4714 stop:4956 length:243 start_codon:yes stop_codon:yes gene_type:complete